jgi:hypothetical protein
MSQEQIRIQQEPGPLHRGTIRIERDPIRVEQGPVIGEVPAASDLAQLRLKANDLKLRVNDLEVRVGQIAQDRANVAPQERMQYNKLSADAMHDLAAARIDLEHTQKQIEELETARDMARVGITVQPPPGRELEAAMERERMFFAGSMVVLIPLVLAFARRLWHRGGPRQSFDLEDSPRLQRMEQAIESIAVEVERIGEAQRFTTKLLTDRQPDAARLGVPARREPGTITPH